MEGAVFLLTLVCYGLALYLWWQEKTPHYFVALVGGHLSALLSPLWAVVYGVIYDPSLEVLREVFGQPLYKVVVQAGAWYYPLPALLVLFLYQRRWWFPGYVS